MRFSIYKNAKFQKGEECTYQLYLDTANSQWLLRLCNDIAAEKDGNKRQALKKHLPVITWQAYFPGRRVNKEAEPSGLFMLDLDHVENPGEVYAKQISSRVKELGIVYVGMTASRHGLRIVAKCLPTLHSIEECQKWLASNLKVEYDSCCKDWARCSYVVHDSYTYFMDAKAIWEDEPAEGMIYDNKAPQSLFQATGNNGENHPQEKANPDETRDVTTDQREGLFGGPKDYKGVPYEKIAKEWLEYTGGEPTEGERNTRLYKLALRMRYITDFNEATMLRVMPSYGLPEEEMRQIIHSALTTNRAADMQKDLKEVLENIDRRAKLADGVEELPEVITSTEKMPSLPPVLRQWVDIAPADFKSAVALCQLPILGALGSRLRARYLDGVMQSPSFLVSLEAPQASGKSFMVRMAETELAQIIDHDEEERAKERAYSEKAAEMKMLNIKVTVENKDEILGTKPKSIVRYVPATMSVTKLLMRMENAQGLHLFALAEEVDTVVKAFKRGFSSYSDLLRVAFDNGMYGQDYASDNSFSGTLRLYYNMLCSGTPKAMRRMYPDVEDGTTSRVLFVTLPDQFGKPMPEWRKFTPQEQQVHDIGLVRLNEVSIQGDAVQPEHEMKLEWLNKEMEKWLKSQKAAAVKDDDRTRDVFCRRAGVVGFRAGMLAWFLWGEKNTPTIRKNTAEFAIWVANNMLNQHLLRFNITATNSNTNKWEEVLTRLPEEFTRTEMERALADAGFDSRPREVLYRWKLLGVIKEVEEGRNAAGKKCNIKFKKVKK